MISVRPSHWPAWPDDWGLDPRLDVLVAPYVYGRGRARLRPREPLLRIVRLLDAAACAVRVRAHDIADAAGVALALVVLGPWVLTLRVLKRGYVVAATASDAILTHLARLLRSLALELEAYASALYARAPPKMRRALDIAADRLLWGIASAPRGLALLCLACAVVAVAPYAAAAPFALAFGLQNVVMAVMGP